MISLEVDDLMQEIHSAEKFRNSHLKNVRRLIRRYVGNWYRDDLRSQARPENMIFSYVAQVLPLIIFDNPQVSVKAIRPVSMADTASQMKNWVFNWIKSDHVYDEARRACLDMLFGYGVFGVCAHDVGGALRPSIFRIAPEAFLFDRQAKCMRDSRFFGHQYRQSLDDLKQDPMVDAGALKDLQADDTRDYGGMKAPLDTEQNYERREEITLYDLYLRDEHKVATLATTQYGKSQWIRRPVEFEGHADGPYVPFGVYEVPSNPLWISPLMQIADHDEEINAHLAAMAEEAAAEKNITLVDANAPGAQATIEEAPTGGIVTIPGLSAQGVASIHAGGVTAGRIQYVQFRRDTADRVNATSDARRGKPEGVTATEAAIAQQSQNARIGDTQNAFRNAIKAAIMRAGWYGYHKKEVIQQISWTDDQGREQEGVHQGGIYEGQEGTRWEDYTLDIEPHSMRRTDPIFEAEQTNAVVQALIGLLPLMARFQEIDWKVIFNKIGDANNLPDLAEQIFRQAPQIPVATGTGAPEGMTPGMPGPGGAGGGMMPPGQGMPPPPAGGDLPPVIMPGNAAMDTVRRSAQAGARA